MHFRAARRRVVKWTHYLPIYERLLSPYRGRALTLVEVGVGDGGSLEAWRGFLGPSARIIGIDLDPAARQLEADGFEIIIGDQADPNFWARHLPEIGPIDVLVDDGGHTSVQQIVTVASVVPHVRDGGVVVVEDTHTSYMPNQYPAARGFGFMEFSQHVVDVLHSRSPMVTHPVADAAGLGRAIHSVQFFESMVVFHVDRRLCGPSTLVEPGLDGLPSQDRVKTFKSTVIDAFDSQPQWMQSLLQPARRAIGRALRSLSATSDKKRVRRYFQ
ncbi:MAG: class I SAM-dependent methyltransferase [Vicinamibacterales bacterium]